MTGCNIAIEVPERLVKGAGLLNTLFLPAWVYKINIILTNNSSSLELCSFNATIANGIRYMKNLYISGTDLNLAEKISVVEPNTATGNDNIIIFANNFKLSPNSETKITFDVCLNDCHTEGGTENTGCKIAHSTKLLYSSHLLYGSNVASCSAESEACDYEVVVKCEDDKVRCGDTTKFYLECKASQYDMVRGLYVRSVLDDGLTFLHGTSNIEPRNVYDFEDKTIIKWDLGILGASEVKKIGFKVQVNNSYKDGTPIISDSILTNKVNSNCINNSAYTQCPSDCRWDLTVEE